MPAYKYPKNLDYQIFCCQNVATGNGVYYLSRRAYGVCDSVFHEAVHRRLVAQGGDHGGLMQLRGDLTNLLASALGVSPMALDVPNIESYVGLMHTFFALEDLYGLKIKMIDDIPNLQIASDSDVNYETLSGLFREWANESGKLTAGEISKEEYDEWRYTYPEIPRERERAERDAARDRMKNETK